MNPLTLCKITQTVMLFSIIVFVICLFIILNTSSYNRSKKLEVILGWGCCIWWWIDNNKLSCVLNNINLVPLNRRYT